MGVLLSFLDLFDYCRNEAAVIGNSAVVGNIEDGNSCGVVDADDALGVLHADLILNRAGNCNVDNVIGLDGRAGLTDLFLVRQPAIVNDRTGSGYLTAENIKQMPALLRSSSLFMPRPPQTSREALSIGSWSLIF